jgi:hypothetical protein
LKLRKTDDFDVPHKVEIYLEIIDAYHQNPALAIAWTQSLGEYLEAFSLQPEAGACNLQVGSYPLATFQYSATTLYQVSYRIR